MGIPRDKITATSPITSPLIERSFSFRPFGDCVGSARPGPRCPFERVLEIDTEDLEKSSGKLLNFTDLHVLVDGKNRVADRRTFWSGSVAGGHGKFAAVAVAADFVGVAVALRAGHGYGAVRNEFTHFRAVTVERHIAAFGLGDFEEVAANAGKADGLRGSSAGVGRGHLFEREIVDAEGDRDKNENADELAHNRSVRRGNKGGKANGEERCQR